MDQPLASSAGNALEVMTAMNCLTMHKVDSRLFKLTVSLGGSLLKNAKISRSVKDGEKMIRDSIESGLAVEKFGKMVCALGGPGNFIDRYRDLLPEAATIVEVKSQSAGYVSQIDVKRLGMVVVSLGGGRRQQDDKLDLSVGLDQFLPLGEKVSVGSVLARVHGRDEDAVLNVINIVRQAYNISEAAPEMTESIIKRIGK
jgi:thymidine phosphorylase